MSSSQVAQNGLSGGGKELMVISESKTTGEDKQLATIELQKQQQQKCDTTNSSTNDSLSSAKFIDQQHLGVDCERLLRNAKKQVKQMMEEAVTKKFIHEGSSSIIALCVSIDACLSHGLRRRALGLFKTNSSTALVQKIAKSCPSAAEVLQKVDEEERRQAEELKLINKKNQSNGQNNNNNNNIANGSGTMQLNSGGGVGGRQKVASNLSVHRRNLWIKCALMERKLVAIVEHLAAEANKYYEPEALMANCVSAQLLCSLLVGPCALEFSCSKTNDYYQFEEPSADELLKRHKLSNPIACLCTGEMNSSVVSPEPTLPASDHNNNQNQNSISEIMRTNSLRNKQQQQTRRRGKSNCEFEIADETNPSSCAMHETAPEQVCYIADSPGSPPPLVRKDSRRRPLALKTNFMHSGALVTECHHYCCQEISEHQHTRGYSFKSNIGSGLGTPHCHAQSSPTGACAVSPNTQQQQQANCLQESASCRWPAWSPRVLHETLHQNSKSNLLFAKNNILLETQAHGTMAGYLSLHQTIGDLILKWTPNQLINGGQQQQQQQQPQPQKPCQSISVEVTSKVSMASQDSIGVGGVGGNQRAHSLDNTAATIGVAGKRQRSSGGRKKSASDVDLGQRVRRLSSNVTNLNETTTTTTTTTILTNSKPLIQSQVAVGSSYLDLVISMSVSRIVLLHCRFSGGGGGQSQEVDSSALIEQQQQQHAEATQLVKDAANEETLILVEADGVQRAPFKFPKGGLRWFLSCLETGLAPDRYLEPTIKLDSSGGGGGGQMIFDEQLPDSSASISTSTTSSEPLLDALLRRLPSLRRRRRNSNDHNNNNKTPSQSRVASPAPGELPVTTRPFNYVYRIVSASAGAAGPPHSALSLASSSSGGGGGSFMLFNNNSISTQGNNNALKTPSKQLSDPTSNGGGQGFSSRWSLSRLTSSFSSASASSRNSSSGSQLVAGGGGGQQNILSSSLDRDCSSSTATNITANEFNLPTTTSANLMKRDSSSELIRIESKLSDLKKTSQEELMALKDQSIQTLCVTMRKQILARAFYGWLAHCRRRKIIRTHLIKLLSYKNNDDDTNGLTLKLLINNELNEQMMFSKIKEESRHGLTRQLWDEIKRAAEGSCEDEMRVIQLERQLHQLVYYGGVEDNQLRIEVWPYLLGQNKLSDSRETLEARELASKLAYESSGRQWIKVERVIKQRDNEILAANMAKVAARRSGGLVEPVEGNNKQQQQPVACGSLPSDGNTEESEAENDDDDDDESELDELNDDSQEEEGDDKITTNNNNNNNEINQDNNVPSQSSKGNKQQTNKTTKQRSKQQQQRKRQQQRFRLESTGSVGSNASITDQFGNNIHRIDKDVQRCDRNFWYFKEVDNLDKLRNIMCTYVWQHLDVGYVQGMCDLAAPFLVIFNDEIPAYHCFNQLMKRMVANFPHGTAMDQHFESLKYLMQVLDPKLFEVLQNNGDYTHFYFCYRWLLLDFKRELAYEDVYRVWETIWSARHVASYHFVVFLALAMVRYYRDIIIENNMDFTDTIKFFNEMAEHHDVKQIIILAQDSIVELEALIKD